MAKNDKAMGNAGEVGSERFDYSQYLPEGLDAKGLRATGGLTPIYAPDDALEKGFPPACGYLDRIEVLPFVNQGKEKDGSPKGFYPMMVRVCCTRPTKGVVGKGENRKSVDIAVGEDVLIPITGNLKTNKTLLASSTDPKVHFFGIFRVTGTLKVNNQPSDMYTWDVMIHEKSKIREGRYALPQSESAMNHLAETSTGEVYNTKTGEVVERAPVAQAAS